MKNVLKIGSYPFNIFGVMDVVAVAGFLLVTVTLPLADRFAEAARIPRFASDSASIRRSLVRDSLRERTPKVRICPRREDIERGLRQAGLLPDTSLHRKLPLAVCVLPKETSWLKEPEEEIQELDYDVLEYESLPASIAESGPRGNDPEGPPQ